MWSKIRHSLLGQIKVLFLLSAILIVSLWAAFLYGSQHKAYEGDMARYYKIVRAQHLMARDPVRAESLFSALDMEDAPGKPPRDRIILEQAGKPSHGFEIYESGGERFLYVRTPMGPIHLKDLKKKTPPYTVHLVFFFLLLFQWLIFLKVARSLRPLGRIHDKLRELHQGDLTTFQECSPYVEISRLVDAYNRAVLRLGSILETREMFNKVFMHEMKTPLAKGMFYAKMEPSAQTHQMIQKLFVTLNAQLDEFTRLESLILKEEASGEQNTMQELLEEAIGKIGKSHKEHIEIAGEPEQPLQGHKELWVICLRNLIDNALKYAADGNVRIICGKNSIRFENRGDPLPLQEGSFKIDPNKRHHSASGFGFGLFIIKTIVVIEGYDLAYTYEEGVVGLSIHSGH